MGLADRDYMKAGYSFEKEKKPKASFRSKLGFFFYQLGRILFKARRKSRGK